ncbi:hypothetical protein C8J57DRAFT_1710714 [Mycena rebaudengoi]|nr:hypothetical protein C8J57DRAFT_1710714 [Mycena rebaudengoi]
MLALSTLSAFFFKGLVSSKSTVTSKSLVSFFGSVLAVAQVSVVVVISGRDFEASMSIVNSGIIKGTPTTKVLLEPTRCTPSSGIRTPPQFFFFGFFIIMLVSLVCTLGTKGSCSGTTAVKLPLDYPVLGGNQQIVFPAPPENWRNLPISDARPPPPPPPEPGSTIKAKPPRKSYFLWLLLVLAVLLVLLTAWIKILYRMPKNSFSFLSRISSCLRAQPAKIVACLKSINRIARSITWAQVVDLPVAVYLAASSVRGLHARVSFPALHMSPPTLSLMALRRLLIEYRTAGIHTANGWLDDIPWTLVTRSTSVLSLTIFLYLLVLLISGAMTRTVARFIRLWINVPGLELFVNLVLIHLIFCCFVLIMLPALLVFEVLVLGRPSGPIDLFYEGHILAFTLRLIVPRASPFLDLLSPFEKLIIFGPASVLAALLILHIAPWLLTGLFYLFSRRRYARAIPLAWILLASAFFCKLCFTDLAYRTVRALIGCTAPVWNPLPLGSKMVLVTPPIAHYLCVYAAPALLHLVTRIKAKAAAIRRLVR